MTGSPFVVNVSRLRRVVGTRRRVQTSGVIADLAVAGSAVPEGAGVAVDVTVEAIIGGVSVAGTVSAPWAGSCRRCLHPAEGRLLTSVRELFCPGGDGADAYPLTGDVVDLAPLARDAVLLELPLAPLCQPGCKGLCPECGADLVRDPCGGHERRDERWAALDALHQAGGS